MPSRDVNAATRFAKVSWRRDKSAKRDVWLAHEMHALGFIYYVTFDLSKAQRNIAHCTN